MGRKSPTNLCGYKYHTLSDIVEICSSNQAIESQFVDAVTCHRYIDSTILKVRLCMHIIWKHPEGEENNTLHVIQLVFGPWLTGFSDMLSRQFLVLKQRIHKVYEPLGPKQEMFGHKHINKQSPAPRNHQKIVWNSYVWKHPKKE
jgi:hypothetical protein